MKRICMWQVCVLAGAAGVSALAQSDMEIGFVEEFAFATNREAAIKQLVPGTDDYYFYTCLQLQLSRQLEKVPPLLTQWVKTHGDTERVKMIRNRQALLTYRQNPQATLDHICNAEGITFNHARTQACLLYTSPSPRDS